MHKPFCPLARPDLSKSEKANLPCKCRERVRKVPSGLSRYVGPKGKGTWVGEPATYIFVGGVE